MTLEEMKLRKKECGYSYEIIAELSGLPLGTVQKVLGGITKSPRRETLLALEAVLTPKAPGLIRETSVAYGAVKRQGDYTLEDYLALPDERRAELIDGVIFDMSAPTAIHQLISAQLSVIFANYIRKNKGSCIPATAPFDVQLDCDNKTIVQPDVMIICDRNKLNRQRLFGAPDLIVEILSPSTRKKDSYLKLHKYSNAGVREYWIVDPDKKRVIVYNFELDDIPTIYTFEDQVPVGIFDGNCLVDFQEIYDYVSFLYENDTPEDE